MDISYSFQNLHVLMYFFGLMCAGIGVGIYFVCKAIKSMRE